MKRITIMFGLLSIGGVVALGIKESKSPEIPQDLKYRYMTHAFQRSELERQFTQSLTPQQRSLSDGIMELTKSISEDEQAMRPTCGSATFGYTPAGEPTCSSNVKPKATNASPEVRAK